MFLIPFIPSLSVAYKALQLALGQSKSSDLNTPRLSSMDNFRDMAGLTSAYSGTAGTLRSGMVYRSNAVTPSPSDLRTLETLGIRLVLDLRDTSEIDQTPDVLPKDATYRHLNVLGSRFAQLDPATFKLESSQQAFDFMVETNRAFVVSTPVREVLSQVILAIAEADGPVLFHCSAGKDRTGWIAALLHYIAWLDDATVMSDYLATNTYTAQRINATLAMMPEELRALYAPAMWVDRAYLNAALDEANTRYGSVQGYLHSGLGLSNETLTKLKTKLVL